MIVFLRILPFLAALITTGGLAVIFLFPEHLFFFFLITLGALFLLLIKLVGGSLRTGQLWVLTSVPLFHFLAAFLILLFAEGDGLRLIIGAITVFLIWIFLENVFNYLYLPRAYHVNALEYTSLVINVVSGYFFTAALFAFRLFLSLSLYWLLPLIFLVALGLVWTTFWACKAETKTIRLYALSGGILATELFTALVFLPSGYFFNAAIVSLFLYLFLGLNRAAFSKKLSKIVFRRYLASVVVLVIIIVLTARWT